MMTCEKKYSNSSDPAILKLWPTQILRRTLTLLPSETERGRRDSEIQVGSSQDNIVESFNKFAHIIVKNVNTRVFLVYESWRLRYSNLVHDQQLVLL